MDKPDQLAAEIAEHLFEMQIQPVWTTDRAMKVTGKGTLDSFRSWLSRYAPRAGCGNGRYSREKILQGLRMEEKTGAKRRSGRHLAGTRKATA